MDVLGIKSETWFAVLMLILGAVLKTIGDTLLDRQRGLRDREARAELRQDARTAARTQFQRTTLLELQEAAQALARATGRLNYEDAMAFRQSGTWGKGELTPEASDASLQASIKLTRLRVRVDDADVRDLAVKFGESCSRLAIARNEAASDQLLAQSLEIFGRLNERIGELVRADL